MLIANPKQIGHDDLIALAKNADGQVKRIFLHWTAGNYDQCFDDYHINIDGDSHVYQTCNGLGEKKAHTWQRNSGSVGITLCCAVDASIGKNVNFGSQPPTAKQIVAMAWVVALICQHCHLPIEYATVTTHGEIAIADGYGPSSGDPEMRWDLLWVPNEKDALNPRQGGVFIRDLASMFAKKMDLQ